VTNLEVGQTNLTLGLNRLLDRGPLYWLPWKPWKKQQQQLRITYFAQQVLGALRLKDDIADADRLSTRVELELLGNANPDGKLMLLRWFAMKEEFYSLETKKKINNKAGEDRLGEIAGQLESYAREVLLPL
jgi:hypothetical protein